MRFENVRNMLVALGPLMLISMGISRTKKEIKYVNI